MAARRVYLATSDALRACDQIDRKTKYRHTLLSERLRHGVIDAETRFQARLASMTGWAAMHGRSDVKMDDVSPAFNKIYFDALSAIPYLTRGASYDEHKVEDIDRLRAEYADFVAQREARSAKKQVPA